MIKVSKTKLDNVLLFQEELGVEVKFLEDDYTYSTKYVLRDIHGDDRTWKRLRIKI